LGKSRGQLDKEHRWIHLDLLQKSSIFSGLLPPDHGLVVRVAGERRRAQAMKGTRERDRRRGREEGARFGFLGPNVSDRRDCLPLAVCHLVPGWSAT